MIDTPATAADRAARHAVVLALVFAATLAHAEPSRCWRELVFEAGNAWAAASSTLTFSDVPASKASATLLSSSERNYLQPRGDTVGLLNISLSAMQSSGEQQIWFDPQSGAALQSRRLGYGRDSRIKVHRLLKDGVWRERRSPDGAGDTGTPDAWPLRSASLLPYPAGSVRDPVLMPVMLLARASALALREHPGKLDFPVFGDTRLHRVVLESRADTTMGVDLGITRDGKTERLTGNRTVRQVDLRPHLVGNEGEKEAFSLFELEGEMSVIVDRATGLPVQIRGEWMRVGTVPVTLTRATLAGACTP